ncbi:MAG: polyketide synthase dehydratase domain-containing protein, partial [Deltaproteobacteria bacterium]|nr:polyketide synthase dehydratase domain-containing protein [Deltaproteobacteria bacterium]
LVDATGRARVRAVVTLHPPDRARLEVPSPVEWPSELRALSVGDDVYGRALFHGPAFQCVSSVAGVWEGGIAATLRRAPAPNVWQPGSGVDAWSVDPLVVDGIFQAMILWCREFVGAPSLPSRIARFRAFGTLPAEEVRIVATVRRRRGGNVLSDVDVLGPGGELLARFDGYTCTASASLEAAFATGRGTARPASPA